jgi:Ran-binding protein 1
MSDQKEETEQNKDTGGDEKSTEEESTASFKPLVELKEVEVVTHEEDEEVLFKMRAKLFRLDPELKQWKERGTGEVKFLQHKDTRKIRLLMRREKTFKLCANHYVSPSFKLKENVGSDRSWVWRVPSDYSDEEPRDETFAIRFANSENANLFKTKFEECQQKMLELQKADKNNLESSLTQLTLKESGEEEEGKKDTEKPEEEKEKDTKSTDA